jgi:cobalt-zinc-cadmium efflux system membrane fusion protein
MLAVLGMAAGIATCKNRPAERSEHHDEHGGHPEGPSEHHDAADSAVHIDRGMLRDLRVTTAPAVSRPAGDTVTVLGELRVNEDAYAEVGSPIPARVSRVMAAPGDTVTVGQPLVELESADVGRARAAVNTAKARLHLARQTVERRRGLAADQIVPQREMQASEAELAQAEAEYRAAQEALTAVGAAGGGGGAKFVLSAPVAGTVIDRTALRGRMTDSEHPLFIVGDLRRLWLIVHAFERDALRMRTSTTARVTFPALPGQSFSGTITRIGSRVDPTSRTIDVRIEVDNPSGVLRPGMSASASVPIGDSNETVVAVPMEAIQRHPQGWCVFIPGEEEGHFEMRTVGRGRDLGGEVEIISGLRAGERVVVEGAFLLKAEADKARGGGEDEHHH